MNITSQDGHQVAYQSNAGQGLISQLVNTGANTTFVARYTIETNSESFSVTKVYTIGDQFIGDYSFFRQFSLFLDYQFSEFIRILLALAIITGIMIYLSVNETLDTSESKVVVAMLLIWVFSIVGWLDTGLVVNSASGNINKLGEFSSQFGIAILSSFVAVFFVFRRIFV
jgi:hypothetical protein